MTILDRYIHKLFIKNLAVILVALVSLYGIIDFIEKVDDFIEHQTAAVYYLTYPLHNLPLMISNTLPMAILLGAFSTIGSLARTNQMTALMGGGLSFTRISRPLFILGVILSGVMLLTNLWLAPWGTREAEYILKTQVSSKQQPITTEHHNLHFKSDDRIINIDSSFPQKGEIYGITMIYFDEQFKPVKRLQASRGEHTADGDWLFHDVKIWQFSPRDKTITGYATHASLRVGLQKEPEDMAQLWNIPEEMTIQELYSIIRKSLQEGYDPLAYQVEAHLRLAKSGIPLIMILLGIPFALQQGRQASFSLGVVISLAIFMTYFILGALFAALGTAAILPPVMAAWSANILMALVGTWMFLRVQD